MTHSFQEFYHEYIDGRVAKGNSEYDGLVLAFISICDYYRYCEASLRTYNELYERWHMALGEHSHDQELNDQFVAATFGVYSNGAVCVDLIRGVNEHIGKGNEGFLAFRKDSREGIQHFQDQRNKIVAHPNDIPNGKFILPKLVFTSGSYGTGGVTFRVISMTQDPEKPSDTIHVNPKIDIQIIRDYLNGLVPHYRKLLLP